MSAPYQVLEDCVNCKVMASVVSIYDPTVLDGLPVESRCRLCGREAAMGSVTRAGVRFTAVIEVIDALDRWAEAEGEPDVERFCAANLGGLSATAVARKVVAGEAVETGFDVFSFLFPGMAGGGGGGSAEPAERPGTRPNRGGTTPITTVAPTIPKVVAVEAEAPADPRRTPARALAAIMVADGVVKDKERRFLETWLARNGHPPLEADDIRAWRPGDLAQPADVSGLVLAMIELAHIDRERDGTEWRVVREFARRWGYPMAELETRGRAVDELVAPVSTQLWRMIRALFVSESR